jgi:hypothetical protein
MVKKVVKMMGFMGSHMTIYFKKTLKAFAQIIIDTIM